MIGSIVARCLASEVVKRVAVSALRELANRTDNKIDNAVVDAIEKEVIQKPAKRGLFRL